jgi:glycosyltransferase involved in cell wall biosynthesis
MRQRFAVLTPSFQQAAFLERTLASVAAQGENVAEHFVADGGSTDGTLELLARHQHRLRWVSEPDRGQPHAVNKALAATSAPLIAWLNSDDLYYPGALAGAAAFLEQHPEVDVVYGRAHHIDANDAVLDEYPVEVWNFERLCETCFLCQPAVFFRRSVVERWGGLDESVRLCADYEFWVRLGQRGARFAFAGELWAASRLHPRNITLGSRVAAHAEMCDMLKRRLGRTPDRWIYNYAHAVVEQRGIPRSSALRFAWELSWETWKAALRWHGRLTGPVLATTGGWLGHHARLALRQRRIA